MIAKITFGGDLHVRTAEGKRGYKGPLFYANPGDLVISKIRVAQGSLCIVPDNLEHLAVSAEYPVYSVDHQLISVDFLRLVIRTSVFKQRISRLRSGNTTKARIRPAQFEALTIPLPVLTEQHALVVAYTAALDRATKLEQEAQVIEEAGLRAFEAALGVAPSPLRYRPVFVARFQDLDRWGHEAALRNKCEPVAAMNRVCSAKLREIIDDIKVGWSPKCLERSATDDEWGVLKLSAISTGEFKDSANKALPVKLAPRPDLEVQPGDVLITRGSGVTRLVGAAVCVESVRSKIMICDLIFRVRFHSQSKIIPKYLTEVLKTSQLRLQIEERRTGAAPMMQKITKSALLDMVIPLPSLEDQHSLLTDLKISRDAARSNRLEAQTLRATAWTAFESALFESE